MRLSKAGYYADLVVYPPLALAMAVTGLSKPYFHVSVGFFLACLLGAAGWTFVEYLMHRFVFHSIRPVAQMHELHHAEPMAFVGSPVWLSLICFGLGAFVPLWSVAALEIASGATMGLMIGYIWYLVVHDAVHRWNLDYTSFLYGAKLRHMAHHYGKRDGNFGVTTGFWDRVFGSVIVVTSRRSVAS